MIISGANLSTDYFTNRQDRYVLIGTFVHKWPIFFAKTNNELKLFFSEDSEELATFCESFIRKISEFSLELQNDGSFLVPHSWDGGHPFEGNYQKFVEAARRSLTEWLASYHQKNRVTFNGAKSVFQSSTTTTTTSSNKLLQQPQDGRGRQNEPLSPQIRSGSGNCRNLDNEEAVEDTWIFPSIQMGAFDVNHDSTLTSRFLESGAPGATFKFATGTHNDSASLQMGFLYAVFPTLLHDFHTTDWKMQRSK